MWNFIKSLLHASKVIRNRNARRLPRPDALVPSVSGGEFPFLLNDLSTPHLAIRMMSPSLPNPCPSFTVIGWNGSATTLESPHGHAAQAFGSIASALNFFQNHSPIKLSNWATSSNLVIHPTAGKDFNAYYDRKHLMFFHDVDPIRNKMIYTCDSVDIVAHELGHALLDAIRPDFWSIQSLEIWSFHEAWADFIAMMTVMQSDVVLQAVLVEVENDLTRSNSISRLAEDMGLAIYNLITTKGVNPSNNPAALRDATNSFAYVSPEKLPPAAPDPCLAAECHSFGRVFLGTMYDIFVGIYKKHLEINHDPLASMKIARDALAYLVLHAAPVAPATPNFFESVARTMIHIDQQIGSPNADVLLWAFGRRKILSVRVRALSNLTLADIDLKKFDVNTEGDKTVLRKLATKVVKLSDHYSIRAQAHDPIYNAEVEIPMQTYMAFDTSGRLVEEIKTTEREAIRAVKACIKYLKDENKYQVGPVATGQFDKEFSIIDGKLVRNFVI